jgi:hypothetical protein
VSQPTTKDEARAASRAATAAARAKKKAERAAELAGLRAACADAARKPPPPEFGSWGVVRTRAWAAAAKRCRSAANNKSTTIDKANAALELIKRALTADIEALSNSLQKAAK